MRCKALLHVALSFFLWAGGPFALWAQLDPIYSCYINNPVTINPALTGANHQLTTTLQFRTQWAGLNANPATINFSSHSSVYRNQGGVGISVIQDKVGEVKNTEFRTMFSYRIPLRTATLSFGMQSGFIRYQNDLSALTILDPGDPAFVPITETSFSTGAGVAIMSDNYFAGISVPRLIPARISNGGQPIELYHRTFYLTGAYLFTLSEGIRLRPSMLMKYISNNPVSVDLNINLLVKNMTAGLFTRNLGTAGILATYTVSGFKVGYTLELPIRSTGLQFTTHEVFVSYSAKVFHFQELTQKVF